MPRNCYTEVTREEQQAQKDRQEKELTAFERKLHPEHSQPSAPPLIDEAKERRRARRANNQRHKPTRQGDTAGKDQK